MKFYIALHLVYLKMEATLCLVCSLDVKPRQHALQCDGCDKWQYRVCNSGKFLLFYNFMGCEKLLLCPEPDEPVHPQNFTRAFFFLSVYSTYIGCTK